MADRGRERETPLSSLLPSPRSLLGDPPGSAPLAEFSLWSTRPVLLVPLTPGRDYRFERGCGQ